MSKLNHIDLILMIIIILCIIYYHQLNLVEGLDLRSLWDQFLELIGISDKSPTQSGSNGRGGGTPTLTPASNENIESGGLNLNAVDDDDDDDDDDGNPTMEIPETQEENTYEAEDFFDRDEFRDILVQGEVLPSANEANSE